MSTRCMVEIRDSLNKGVLLYHHTDGYPGFQLPKLVKFLEEARDFLDRSGHPYWWDEERVAAILVLLSARSYREPKLLSEEDCVAFRRAGFAAHVRFDDPVYLPDNGVPVYQPAAEYQGDLEYLYEVNLAGDHGLKDTRSFTITVYEMDGNKHGKNITLQAFKEAAPEVAAYGPKRPKKAKKSKKKGKKKCK